MPQGDGHQVRRDGDPAEARGEEAGREREPRDLQRFCLGESPQRLLLALGIVIKI